MPFFVFVLVFLFACLFVSLIFEIFSWNQRELFNTRSCNVPSFFTQVLVVYNFACSLISFYSVAVIVVALARNWPHSLFVCEEDELVKHALWVYYMTKYVELLDTVFMVLRHRQRQISLLHVSNIRCPPFCQAHGFLFQINRLLSIHIWRQNCLDIVLKYGKYWEQKNPHPSPFPPFKVAVFVVFYR